MNSMYRQMFSTFFRIGGFTFGGGYAMLPLIEHDLVDKRKWISREDFIDLFAVAQSLPGVFAVNISIFLGYRLKRIPGALICAAATVLPCFSVILLIAIFFVQLRENPVVVSIFNGIRPAVVAMIAAPVISTWRSMKMKSSALWIPVVSALSVWYFGVSPIWIVLVSAIGGILYVFLLRDYFRKVR